MERLADVMPNKAKCSTGLQVPQVIRAAGAEVVQADDLVPVRQNPVAEMRTDEACGSSDNDVQVSPSPAFIVCGSARAGGARRTPQSIKRQRRASLP